MTENIRSSSYRTGICKQVRTLSYLFYTIHHTIHTRMEEIERAREMEKGTMSTDNSTVCVGEGEREYNTFIVDAESHNCWQFSVGCMCIPFRPHAMLLGTSLNLPPHIHTHIRIQL